MKKLKISNKIQDLFDYRKLTMLLSMDHKLESKFLKKLFKLQTAIYYLDQYLENNWELKNKTLKSHWKMIIKQLVSLGYSNEQACLKTNHIRRYQKQEVQLRSNLYPTRLNQEFYYHYKTCDVRLIREIIHDKYKQLNNFLPHSAWRYFDIVSEVNDDIEDVFEDQHSINGNFFLISLIEQGLDKTRSDFISFLDLMAQKQTEINNKNLVGSSQLELWFDEYLIDTKLLLDKNLQQISKMNTSLRCLLFDD